MDYINILILILSLGLSTNLVLLTYRNIITEAFHKKPVTWRRTPKAILKPMENVGSLHCVVGPMFSGKTSRMMSEIGRFVDIMGNSAQSLIINHSSDTREGLGELSPHSSLIFGPNKMVDVVSVASLSEAYVNDVNVIGIDEAQFFPDLFQMVSFWLKQGKHIYCAGLDSCHKMENFGELHLLLPISNTFVKLNAVCHLCHEGNYSKIITPSSFVDAPFTKKIAGSRDLKVDVGGSELYIPVCRSHYEAKE